MDMEHFGTDWRERKSANSYGSLSYGFFIQEAGNDLKGEYKEERMNHRKKKFNLMHFKTNYIFNTTYPHWALKRHTHIAGAVIRISGMILNLSVANISNHL